MTKTSYKVYLHRRKDTNEIFYVGHGKDNRPWAMSRGRSHAWHNIADTVGCDVEVIARYDDKELAGQHEMIYIAGCRLQGIGIVNRRSGGNDRNETGITHSNETIDIMRQKALARPDFSISHCANISKSKLGHKPTKGTTGTRCYTNGVQNRYVMTSPGPGWTLGKTYKKLPSGRPKKL